MSNSPDWQGLDDLTQPPGFFQVRKPIPTHSPTAPVGELSMGMFLAPENRTYLSLALGNLIALIAFFMPFFTVSTVVSGTPTFLNIPLAEASPLPTAGSDAANGFPLLWLVLLIAVVGITVAAILVLDSGTPRSLVTPIVGSIVFLISGLTGFAVLIGSLFRAKSDIAAAGAVLNSHPSTHYHLILGIGPGFWLCLLAMLCVATLGGIALRRAW